MQRNSILSALLLVLGCSDYGEPDAAFVQSEISSACMNATPVATFTGRPNFTSPNTYNQAGCYKGQVVDVTNLTAPVGTGGFGGGAGGTSSGGNGSGGLVGTGAGPTTLVKVEMVTPPTTEAECTAAWAGGYSFRKQADGSFATEEIITGTGLWFSPSFCTVSATFRSVIGESYRYAVSVRTAQTSSAPTRALKLH